MSVRCNVEVKGKVMEAIVDSGAATNIMTKGLQEKLGIKITEKSNARFTIANGQTLPALGKTMVKVRIENEEIPMKVQIIDSRKKDLILGTEMLAEMKGKIDFEERELRIEHNGKEVITPIFYNRKKVEIREEEESQEFEDDFNEEIEEEELSEEEFEKNLETLEEKYEEEYEEEWEDFDKSPAYYLAELL